MVASLKGNSIGHTKQYWIKYLVILILLTSLSPSLSTLQCKKAVCPMTTVTFLWTSKSKYGIKYDEAGSIVEEKLHDSEIEKHNKYLY